MKYLILNTVLILLFISYAQNTTYLKIKENTSQNVLLLSLQELTINKTHINMLLIELEYVKNDILSVNSFLDSLTTKVYFNDLMRGFCDFEKQIIADVNKDSSSLSCVHVGKERLRRNLKLPLSLNKNNKTTYYKPDYRGGAHDQYAPGWNNNPTPLKEPGPSGTRP